MLKAGWNIKLNNVNMVKHMHVGILMDYLIHTAARNLRSVKKILGYAKSNV